MTMRNLIRNEIIKNNPFINLTHTAKQFEEKIDRELIKIGVNPETLRPLKNKEKIKKTKRLEIVWRFREEKNQDEYMIIASKKRVEEAKDMLKFYHNFKYEEIQTKRIEGKLSFLVYGIVKR